MWRKYMLEVVKELPIESFPARPPLTGRQETVKAEALKPKRSYHQRLVKPTHTYTPPAATTGTTPTPVAQPTPTPTDTPVSTPKPQPEPSPKPPQVDNPFTRKIPANHPINDPNRDWVKERLGR